MPGGGAQPSGLAIQAANNQAKNMSMSNISKMISPECSPRTKQA